MTAERRQELEDLEFGSPNSATSEEMQELLLELILKSDEVERERNKLIEKVGGIDIYNKLLSQMKL